METGYYFTDKNRDYRNYYTEYDDKGNKFSQILFHKVYWRVGDREDINELQDWWAEEIMQYIINGYRFGYFAVLSEDENGEEVDLWIEWRILTDWPDDPFACFDKSVFDTE